ncbi:hypothetical protein DL765_005153 [Monosporascus sp. GIB2]|nr:hypothetical protein DL765_005153 [Monosporascus sp. GIB2]
MAAALSNNGYDYKNSTANGCFFNLGARLARYLDNQTYAEWAEKTWDWVGGIGLMDDNYSTYDGRHIQYNSIDINGAQFSYNSAVFWLRCCAYVLFLRSAPEVRYGHVELQGLRSPLDGVDDTGNAFHRGQDLAAPKEVGSRCGKPMHGWAERQNPRVHVGIRRLQRNGGGWPDYERVQFRLFSVPRDLNEPRDQ